MLEPRFYSKEQAPCWWWHAEYEVLETLFFLQEQAPCRRRQAPHKRSQEMVLSGGTSLH